MSRSTVQTRGRPPHRTTRDVLRNLRSGSSTEEPASDAARELRRRWCGGERTPVEEFLATRPELHERPEAAVELIYEEYCLRHAAGEEGVEQDLLRRFPQWEGPLRVMLDCHRRLLRAEPDEPRYPAAGDRVGDFLLETELGHGARGRVFLATQTALADRPVVLKITPLDGREHLSLARLQHTHIVPLYAVSDDTDRGIRILCMPYFGRATLASLLELLKDTPPHDRTGRHVVEAIDRLSRTDEKDMETGNAPAEAAARQMLEHVSFVQAMCWIAACLADALQFAHERGVVHLDLKPSNVLLGSDGQPMLLDFHLAREPLQPGGEPPDNFGGTPHYMPPEQLDALQALREGAPITQPVDGRADVFALGVMLYEALAGRLPTEAESPALASINPQVSLGLSDIVAKCIAPRAEDRYADAASLADDLRRHLTDQPLADVPNRSIGERWRKWRRRRPGTFRAARMGALVAAMVAILAAAGWSLIRDRRAQAELALRDGRQLQQAKQYAQATQTLERGLALLDHIPFQSGLRTELAADLLTARRLHLAHDLHQLADAVRVLYLPDGIPPHRLAAVASECRAVWSRRAGLLDSLGPAREAQVTDDLRDIAIFAAKFSTPTGGANQAPGALLDEAEALFGASPVLEVERHRRASRSSGTPPSIAWSGPRNEQSAWEHYALGRALLESGDTDGASAALSAALRLDPAGRWPNFYWGLCAARMGRHGEAVAAFSVCIGADPKIAGYFHNRGNAQSGLGRADLALDDYTHALALDPTHAAAALNRGMLHYEARRLSEAMSDLQLALQLGADPASVHYNLALVHLAAGKPDAAEMNMKDALQHKPDHERAQRLRETLRSPIP